MRNHRSFLGWFALLGGLLSFGVSGCGGSQRVRAGEDAATGSGGTAGATAPATVTGGSISVPGGTTAGAGGASVAGGSTGRASASATAVAGQSATGGKASAGTGGTTATGGSTAIASTGGTSASGGSVVVAGKTASGGVGGTGGTAKAGSSGTGGVGGTGGTTALGGTTASGGTTGAGGARSSGSNPGQCPAASDYVGDPTWPHSLVATSGAQYCGTFNEERTLEQEYASKAKLVIAPGTYPVPGVAGTYPFALPVCFERKPGSKAPGFAGAGTDTLARLTTSTRHHSFNQPLSLPGETWSFQGDFYYPDATPAVLDGNPTDPFGGPGFRFSLCTGAECYQWDDVTFAACNPTSFALHRHTVTFTGGQVVLDLRKGMSAASTEPAAFVVASGTLDGVAFSQTDYWKLVYSPTHHHYTRTFAALFDTPIGGACGLKVLALDPSDQTLPKVSTINCDLSDLASRPVLSSVTTHP